MAVRIFRRCRRFDRHTPGASFAAVVASVAGCLLAAASGTASAQTVTTTETVTYQNGVRTVTRQETTTPAGAAPGRRPAGVPPDVVRRFGLNTLKAGLDSVAWDPAERGPLIAVAPESARPDWLSRPNRPDGGIYYANPPQPPQPASNGQYRLSDLADYFGRRVVYLKGIAVCAPGTMVVFNTDPGKPDLYAGFSQQDRMRMLEASLTESQWKALGSEQGLGAGDLNPDQRDLFLACLPDPFTVRTERRMGGGYMVAFGSDEQPVTLTAAQRSNVRLRISREILYRIPYEGFDNATGAQLGGGFSSGGSGGDEVTVHTVADRGIGNSAGRVFGQTLRGDVPARLKPQQIDFDAAALNAPVSVAGAQTVGDLVARIRQATRVEVYVDGGMGRRSVWIRAGDSDTVRAGELLKALCWGVTGAVRSLGEGVFVLSDDVEGYGTRLARIGAWLAPVQEARNALVLQQGKAIRDRQPLQYLGIGGSDMNAVDAGTRKKIEESWKNPSQRYMGVGVPTADLPQGVQNEIKRVLERQANTHSTINGQPATLSTTRVMVSETALLQYVVPGMGSLMGQGYSSMASDLYPLPDYSVPSADGTAAPPPKPADTIALSPALAAGTALCVAPTTPDAARAAVRAARARGIPQLWLIVPAAAGSSDDALRAATAAGKAILAAATDEAALAKPAPAVVGVVPLLSLAPDGAPAAGAGNASATAAAAASQATAAAPPAADPALDLNVLGETGRASARKQAAAARALPLGGASGYLRFNWDRARDWLDPAAPGVASRLKRRLLELAATPHLSGLALLDAAAPGYGSADSSAMYFLSDVTAGFGYTLQRRREFVRAKGYDPVDIPMLMNGGSFETSLPFMDSASGFMGGMGGEQPVKERSSSLWRAARYQEIAAYLAGVYGDLSSSARADGGAPLPLYLHSLDSSPNAGLGGWYARWTKADVLPTTARPATTRPAVAAAVPAAKGGALAAVGAAPAAANETVQVVPYLPESRYPTVVRSAEQDLPLAVRYAHQVNTYALRQTGAPRRLLLDLSLIPCDDALALLDAAMPAGSAAAKTAAVAR